MAEFFRKVEPSKNIVLSEIYPDMYMGNQPTSNIGGGRKEQALLSRFTLPNIPTFGDAELKRLDYNLYVNSITLAPNSIQFPELALYKTKNAERLSISEGSQEIDDAKTADTIIFTSHINNLSSIKENFNGEKSAGSDSMLFQPVQRTIIRTSRLYITIDNAYNKLQEKTWGVLNGQDYTKSELKDNYGIKAGDVGITSLDSETIIMVPTHIHDPAQERWGYDISAEFEAAAGKEGYKTLFLRKKDESKLVAGDRDTIPNTDLYGDELTPSNSIFEYVRGATEFFGEQKKGESGVELLATGAARLSTTTQLTGGQAGELYTFWKANTNEVNYSSLGTYTDSDGTLRDGPSDRQEVLLLKKNIPFPIKHPAKPYRSGDAGTSTSQDANDFANNIELDINIKQLAKAYKIQSTNGSTDMYSLRRSLVVCFSEEAPLPGETFFEFVYKHSDKTIDNINPNGHTALSRTNDSLDFYGNTSTELSSHSDQFTQNYGVPLSLTYHAAGTGLSNGTYATNLYPGRADGWASSGNGLTVTVAQSGGSATGTPVIGTAGNGYKVGDRVVVKDGNFDCIVEIASITRKTKSFSAMAFLNTENGIMVSNNAVMGGLVDHRGQTTGNATLAAGPTPDYIWGNAPDSVARHGKITTIGQNPAPWWCDESHGDILVYKSNMYSNSQFAESFLNQWVRLNFLVNAQSGAAKSINSVNPHAHGLLVTAESDTELALDNMQGVPEVGDFLATDGTGQSFGGGAGSLDPYVTAVNSVGTGPEGRGCEVTISKAASLAANDYVAFFKPSDHGLGGRLDLDVQQSVTGYNQASPYDASGMKAPRDGSWGRLLISTPSDGKLMQRSNFSTFMSTADQFWSMNSSNGIQPSSDLSLWTRHMSVWLLNYKYDHDVDKEQDLLLDTGPVNTTSQVFIDKVEFKNFNYDIENPNMNERNINPNSISIASNTALGARNATSDTNVAADKIDIYKSVTPTMMSIGTSHRHWFGSKDASRTDEDYAYWPSDESAWLMFHNFKCSNLASLEEVPDENMIGTFTHSGGVGQGDGKARWGESYNTDYGLAGFADSTHHAGIFHINRNDSHGISSFSSGGAGGNINTKYLPTFFKASGAVTSGDTVTVEPITAGLNLSRRQHSPFRVGDSIIFAMKSDDSNNDEFIIENVDQVSTNNYTITITTNFSASAGSEVSAGDAVFIRPEGLVNNFTKKGLMHINSHVPLADTGNDVWGKRECGPASARIMEIIDKNQFGCTLQVDTVKPLLLDKDEQYICYLYGSEFTSSDFLQTESNDRQRSEVSGGENVKSGLTISDIDSDSMTISLNWDGVANDTTTQLITEDNLPALMISPWRYWIHLNIENSGYWNSVPTTPPLPNRTYDSFSLMKHNFPRWDNSTYKTAVLSAAITSTTTQTIGVDRMQDFAVGETFMIDDEAMTCVARADTTGAGNLTVLRGVSGTSTNFQGTEADPAISGEFEHMESNDRIGQTHADASKIKTIDVYTAWGEKLSNVDTVIDKTGALGTLAGRRNLGSTYRETVINHETVSGVPGAYVNNWKPTVLSQESVIQGDVDFGFGSYSEEEQMGGQLSNQIIKSGQYNLFKCHGISAADDFEAGKDIDLLLRYKDDTVPHITNVNTRHSATNKPFALAVFEDVLPQKPTLSVGPDKVDEFYPEFTWNSQDDDLWYGILHVDTSPINSQYHNKIAHIPLNEDADAFGSVYLEDVNNTKTAATAGTFTDTFEGLAGHAKDFNGTSDYIKFGSFDDITSELTVIVHIVPDTHAGTHYILNQSVAGQTYSDWEIYMDSSRQINAKVMPTGQASSPITLQSSPIVVDGETPTCIILTVDKNIKAGNVKLFINGILDDQSGLILATHTTNNWKNDTNILDSSGPLFIGADIAADNSTTSDFFDGKIEEIIIYDKCLYPIVPASTSFKFTKPVQEISNGSPLAYSARLFMKDYHNVRGATVKDVATSSPVTFRKAAFRLSD